jgi:hypothetical protein
LLLIKAKVIEHPCGFHHRVNSIRKSGQCPDSLLQPKTKVIEHPRSPLGSVASYIKLANPWNCGLRNTQLVNSMKKLLFYFFGLGRRDF